MFSQFSQMASLLHLAAQGFRITDTVRTTVSFWMCTVITHNQSPNVFSLVSYTSNQGADTHLHCAAVFPRDLNFWYLECGSKQAAEMHCNALSTGIKQQLQSGQKQNKILVSLCKSSMGWEGKRDFSPEHNWFLKPYSLCQRKSIKKKHNPAADI